jgi:hypothetical protein
MGHVKLTKAKEETMMGDRIFIRARLRAYELLNAWKRQQELPFQLGP